MPLPDDLLQPIPGENPSGASLRYDPVYDKIKEARREETQPPPGMTEQDRKVADNTQVIKLTTDLLTNKSKDLQLAAWYTEASLKKSSFAGLRDGLALCLGLLQKFWDTLYPELEDGDAESRSAPLGFVGTKLEIPLKLLPVVEKRYNLVDYQQSRELGYEDLAKTDDAKKSRAAKIKEGKLTPEAFDKAFEETPKKFYAQAEQDLDACIQLLTQLKKVCDEKFGNEGPSYGPLQKALEAERHLIHVLLQKKREKEPDPVEPVPAAAEGSPGADGEGGAAGAAAPVRTGVLISFDGSSEPPDRIDTIKKIAEAAAFLRRREPQSPASYLMLRGLRWGELRAAIELADPTKLEAPPTDLRRHLKRLLLDKKYEELIEAAESAMALPCSRAWLDMQRFVVEACEALGSGYEVNRARHTLGIEGVGDRHSTVAGRHSDGRDSGSECGDTCLAGFLEPGPRLGNCDGWGRARSLLKRTRVPVAGPAYRRLCFGAAGSARWSGTESIRNLAAGHCPKTFWP